MTKWDSSQVHKVWKSTNVLHRINKRKVKNHTIISIDAEKPSEKIQHPFMIKTLTKLCIEGTNIIKSIYDKSTANIILKGEKMKAFLLNWNKTRMPTLTIFIQHSIGSPSHRKQVNKRNKVSKLEELKLSLYADDMMLYIENPKNST